MYGFGMKRMTLLVRCGVLLFAPILLLACGGDSTSSKEYVVEIDSSVDVECSTEILDDKSGIKVICNGDSVGFVSNPTTTLFDVAAEDSAIGMKCVVSLATSTQVQLNCNDSTYVIPLVTEFESDSILPVDPLPKDSVLRDSVSAIDSLKKDSSIIEPEEEIISIEDADLSGVSQKGPFVVGTSVTAYELLNGRTLKQTGSSFSGSISSNDGRFNIKSVKLKSQYAYLVADGYYRNEVTGRNSKSQIRLRALTNLKGRKSANVNLMTHLEYDRVLYLVTQKGFSVVDAKKKAQSEIYKAFHIDSENFKSFSEDLDVFGHGDENAALLAISILLQGNRSEAELTSLLTSFSYDFAEDGEWNDSASRAKVADWIFSQDTIGGFRVFRENVEKWNLGSVPGFEDYARNFWISEYQLGACTDKVGGSVVMVPNRFSKFNAKTTDETAKLVRFTCDANGWRVASAAEKDTVGFGSGKIGELKKALINPSFYYIYVNSDSGKYWRLASTMEKDTLGLPLDLHIENGKLIKGLKTDSMYYWNSENKVWVEAIQNDIAAGMACVVATDGLKADVLIGDDKGKKTNSIICDNGNWRTSSVREQIFGLCNDRHVGDIVRHDSVYVLQAPDSWMNQIIPIFYFMCKKNADNYEWNIARDEEYNMRGVDCDEPGKIYKGVVIDSISYKCEGNGVVSRINPKDLLAINPENPDQPYACDVHTRGKYARLNGYESFFKCETQTLYKDEGECENYWSDDCEDKLYLGEHGEWRITFDSLNVDTSCVKNSENLDYCFETVGVGKYRWMAENLNYMPKLPDSIAYFNDMLDCFKDDCDTYGMRYFWSNALLLDSIYDYRMADISNVQKGVCPEGWRIWNVDDLLYLKSIHELYVDFFLKKSEGGEDIAGLHLDYGCYAYPDQFSELIASGLEINVREVHYSGQCFKDRKTAIRCVQVQ